MFRNVSVLAEKYVTFSVPIKNELDNVKIVTYKLKFIDSYRFMSTSLSDLVDNLSEILKKNANHAWKEEILNQNVILSGLKIID